MITVLCWDGGCVRIPIQSNNLDEVREKVIKKVKMQRKVEKRKDQRRKELERMKHQEEEDEMKTLVEEEEEEVTTYSGEDIYFEYTINDSIIRIFHQEDYDAFIQDRKSDKTLSLRAKNITVPSPKKSTMAPITNSANVRNVFHDAEIATKQRLEVNKHRIELKKKVRAQSENIIDKHSHQTPNIDKAQSEDLMTQDNVTTQNFLDLESFLSPINEHQNSNSNLNPNASQFFMNSRNQVVSEKLENHKNLAQTWLTCPQPNQSLGYLNQMNHSLFGQSFASLESISSQAAINKKMVDKVIKVSFSGADDEDIVAFLKELNTNIALYGLSSMDILKLIYGGDLIKNPARESVTELIERVKVMPNEVEKYREKKRKNEYLPLNFVNQSIINSGAHANEKAETKVTLILFDIISKYGRKDRVILKMDRLRNVKQCGSMVDYINRFKTALKAIEEEIRFRNRLAMVYCTEVLDSNMKTQIFLRGMKLGNREHLLKMCYKRHKHCALPLDIMMEYTREIDAYNEYITCNSRSTGAGLNTFDADINGVDADTGNSDRRAGAGGRRYPPNDSYKTIKSMCNHGSASVCSDLKKAMGDSRDCKFAHTNDKKQVRQNVMRWKEKQCFRKGRCFLHAKGICRYLHPKEEDGTECYFNKILCTWLNGKACDRKHIIITKKRYGKRPSDLAHKPRINESNSIQKGTHASATNPNENAVELIEVDGEDVEMNPVETTRHIDSENEEMKQAEEQEESLVNIREVKQDRMNFEHQMLSKAFVIEYNEAKVKGDYSKITVPIQIWNNSQHIINTFVDGGARVNVISVKTYKYMKNMHSLRDESANVHLLAMDKLKRHKSSRKLTIPISVKRWSYKRKKAVPRKEWLELFVTDAVDEDLIILGRPGMDKLGINHIATDRLAERLHVYHQSIKQHPDLLEESSERVLEMINASTVYNNGPPGLYLIGDKGNVAHVTKGQGVAKFKIMKDDQDPVQMAIETQIPHEIDQEEEQIHILPALEVLTLDLEQEEVKEEIDELESSDYVDIWALGVELFMHLHNKRENEGKLVFEKKEVDNGGVPFTAIKYGPFLGTDGHSRRTNHPSGVKHRQELKSERPHQSRPHESSKQQQQVQWKEQCVAHVDGKAVIQESELKEDGEREAIKALLMNVEFKKEISHYVEIKRELYKSHWWLKKELDLIFTRLNKKMDKSEEGYKWIYALHLNVILMEQILDKYELNKMGDGKLELGPRGYKCNEHKRLKSEIMAEWMIQFIESDVKRYEMIHIREMRSLALLKVPMKEGELKTKIENLTTNQAMNIIKVKVNTMKEGLGHERTKIREVMYRKKEKGEEELWKEFDITDRHLLEFNGFRRTMRELGLFDTFAKNGWDVIEMNVAPFDIQIFDDRDTKILNYYSLCTHDDKIAGNEIKKWIQKSLARYANTSDKVKMASPFFVTHNIIAIVNGKYLIKSRITIDYKLLNSITIDVPYMQRDVLSEILLKMNRKRFFGTSDINKYYYSIPMTDTASMYAAISTANGVIIPNRMATGLKGAPKYASTITHELFNDVDTVVVMDDINMGHMTLVEHLRAKVRSYQKAKDYGVKLHAGKEVIGASGADMAGHKVCRKGTMTQPRHKTKCFNVDKRKLRTINDMIVFRGLLNGLNTYLHAVSHKFARLKLEVYPIKAVEEIKQSGLHPNEKRKRIYLLQLKWNEEGEELLKEINQSCYP